MIRGTRLELCQCTGHRQRKGLHLTNLLPMLLTHIGVGVVLMIGIQVVAVYSCASAISLCHTPGQNYPILTWHQFQLWLLRRGGPLSLGG